MRARAVPFAAIASCALALAAEPAPAADPDPAAGLPASPPAHHGHVEVVPDPSLTLRSALDAALERDPGQARLAARDDAAQVLRRVARAWTPEPMALAAHGARDDIGGSHDGYRAWDAGIEIPLWIPGQRAARRQVAEYARAGAKAARAQRELELAGVLRELLADWARARARVTVAVHALGAAEALEAALRRAAELGETADRERLLAEEETLGRRDALLRARARLRDVELRWNAFTGLDRAPQDASEPRAPERPFGPGHPLIAEAEARVARAKAALVQATRDEWQAPLLAVASEHERDTRDEPTNDRLGFGLRLPLGPSAAARERVAEARLALGEARADLGSLRRALDVALHAAVHQLGLAEDRLRIAETRHELAVRNLRLEERAFALGESDLLDRLRIQARAFEAELALAEARADRQLSLARHNQALGLLP